METLIAILFYCAALLAVTRLRFFTESGIEKKQLLIYFHIKLLAGFVLFWIYSNYYPNRSEADIFKYFDDSKILFESIYTQPGHFFRMLFGINCEGEEFYSLYYYNMNNWDRAYDSNIFNDSHTIIRVNALLRLLTFGSYFSHLFIFNLLGFTGLIALYKVFVKTNNCSPKLTVPLLLLMPSLTLWTSGVLKESIVIFAIGMIWYLITFIKPIGWKNLLFLTGCIFMVFQIKFYVLISLLPCLLAYFLLVKTNKRPLIIFSAMVGGAGLLAFLTQFAPDRFNLLNTLIAKQADFIRLAEYTGSGSQFELNPLAPTLWGILKVVPEGLLNCFIRPLPWEAKSLIYIPAVIENLVILILIILSIRNFNISKKKLSHFVWFSIAFTLVLFVLIGITTPVAGALVRYKVPALPFLIFFLSTLINRNINAT